MATSRAELVEARVVFDCPLCGVHHDGPIKIHIESDSMDMEIDMFDVRSFFVQKTLRTSACGDAFVIHSITSEPTWKMTLTAYDDDRPTRLGMTLAS